jgi:hypothetical protein
MKLRCLEIKYHLLFLNIYINITNFQLSFKTANRKVRVKVYVHIYTANIAGTTSKHDRRKDGDRIYRFYHQI